VRPLEALPPTLNLAAFVALGAVLVGFRAVPGHMSTGYASTFAP
jgi:hypothetical protein